MKTLDEIPPSWSQILPADDGAEDGCNSSRFKCVMSGEAVLDKETGLVWARRASYFGYKTWNEAATYCRNIGISHRKGWRLPTIDELSSLVATDHLSYPYLPIGHPFLNEEYWSFWSSTVYENDSSRALFITLYHGASGHAPKTNSNYVWPVRGGN